MGKKLNGRADAQAELGKLIKALSSKSRGLLAAELLNDIPDAEVVRGYAEDIARTANKIINVSFFLEGTEAKESVKMVSKK